jgi:hypothetical protein
LEISIHSSLASSPSGEGRISLITIVEGLIAKIKRGKRRRSKEAKGLDKFLIIYYNLNVSENYP